MKGWFRKRSLRFKATLVVLTVITLTLTVMAVASIVYMHRWITDKQEHDVDSIVQNLVSSCELALAVQDQTELERLVHGYLWDPSVLFIAIYNKDDEPIVHTQQDESAWHMYTKGVKDNRDFIVSDQWVKLDPARENFGVFNEVKNSVSETSEAKGKPEITSTEPRIIGRVVVGLSLEPVRLAKQSQLTVTLFVFLCATAVSTVIVSWSVRLWAQRLCRLVNASERMSQGDFTLAINDSHVDEIGRLCRAFEHMRDTVQQRDADLRQFNETLQNRVEERTAELKEEIQERTQAEESLRLSEQRFRDIAESMSDWIWEVDADGVYTSSSANGTVILGYEVEEIIGKTPFDFMDSEEAQKIRPVFEEFSKQRQPISNVENWNRTKDGRLVCLLTNGIPIYDEQGEYVGYRGVDADITERKQYEEAMQRSEAKFRTLFESSSDAVMMLDENGFFDCNDATLRMFICADKGEFCSNHPGDLSPAKQPCGTDSMTLANEQIATAMKKGSNRFEWMHRRTDGNDFPAEVLLNSMEIGGKKVLQAVVRDITYRKRAEEELREINAFQEKLLSTAATAIFTVDADKCITSANSEFCDVTGFSEDEVVGQHCDILQGQPCLERCGLYDPDRKEPIFKKQCTVRSKDGRQLNVLKNADWIHDESGKVTGGIESFVDVTELVEAKEAAEAASRAKSEFLATMSHEIRTPMNGVIGTLELLRSTSLDTKQLRYAQIARSSANALLGLINNILDFSKIEAGKMTLDVQGFDLEALVEDVIGMFSQQAGEKKIELINHMYSDVPLLLRGDPDRIRQILMNLLGNAIKFTDKGEVLLQVKAEEETDEYIVVRISIRDTGIGISQDKIDLLFELFTQADSSTTRKYGGSGLGLAICKHLVEMMGGKIGVESKPEKGSTFWFTAKLDKQQGFQRTPSKDRIFNSLQRLRVMVVDDNETNREVLREQLESWGCVVQTTTDGESALETLEPVKENAKEFDIAILDMHMPGMDGVELAKKIKSIPEHEDISLILLSSVDEQQDPKELRRLGFEFCLHKPVLQSQLYNILLQLVHTGSVEQRNLEDNAVGTFQNFTNLAKETSLIRVLLAEDNEINQEVAFEILVQAGFQCDVVGNGKEAVEAVLTGKYGVVLMDCAMPEMDGFEATRIIRQKEADGHADSRKSCHIPIIALTANAIQGDREVCLEAGMDDYISKPFEAFELISKIMKATATPDVSTIQNTHDVSEDRKANEISGDSAAQETQAPIDFDSLLRRCVGNSSIMEKILGKFQDKIQEDLDKISESVKKSDVDQIALLAHALKGAAGNLSAESLREIAAELEQLGRSGELEQAEHYLARLHQEVERCLAYLPEAENFIRENAQERIEQRKGLEK